MAKIPQSLQPTLMGGGGAITVADKKIIKQYGDLQSGKKYIAQKRQFEQKQKTQVEKIRSQIEAAKKLPAQASAAAQAELRKVLETIKEGTLYQNVNEIISSVNRYAGQVQEQYNIQRKIDKRERQDRENQRALAMALADARAKQTVTMYETTPEIISYTGGKRTVVERPRTNLLYTDTRTQREIEKLRKAAGTQRQLTAKERAAIEQMKSDVGQMENLPTAPVSKRTGPEVPTGLTPQQKFEPGVPLAISPSGEITIMEGPERLPTPKEKQIKEFEKIAKSIEIREGTLAVPYKVDRPKQDERFKPIEQGSVVYTPEAPEGFRDVEYKLEDKPEVETPSFSNILQYTDQRSTVDTILGVGGKPLISSQDAPKVLQKAVELNLQERKKKDFEAAIESKQEEIFSKIKVEDYQKRIDQGEDYEKVTEEYETRIEKGNKQLQEFAKDFDKRWDRTTGQKLIKESEKVMTQAQVYYGAKATQERVGSYFGVGAATGAAFAVGGTVAAATAPASIPILTGLGVGAFGATTAIQYLGAGKTVKGKKQDFIDMGFGRREARQMALVSGATQLAPFAYTSAGALAGGTIAGTITRPLTKEIITTKEFGKKTKLVGVDKAGDKAVISYKGSQSGKEGFVTPRQQLAELSYPGQRTVVQTRLRSWLGMQPLTQGYPGGFGQNRAYALLRYRGYSPTQATQILQVKPATVVSQSVAGFISSDTGRGYSKNIVDVRRYGLTSQGQQKLISTESSLQKTPIAQVSGEYGKVQGGTRYLFTSEGYPQTITKFTSPTQQIIRTYTEQPTTMTGFADVPDIQQGGYADIGTLSGRFFGPSSGGKEAGIILFGSKGAYRAGISGGAKVTAPGTSTPGPVKTTRTTSTRTTSGTGQVTQQLFGVGQSTTDIKFMTPPPTPFQPAQTSATVLQSPSTSNVFLPLLSLGSTTDITQDYSRADTQEQDSELDTSSISLFSTGTLQDTTTTQVSLTDSMFGTEQLTDTGTTQLEDTTQDTTQVTQPVQDITSPTIGTGTIPDFSTPPRPRRGDPGDGVSPPPIIRFRFPGERSAQDMVTAYKGEVLTRGKYKQVTKNPKTKDAAYDAVARVIDNTVSAQGRVVPMKKKVRSGGKVIDTIVKMAQSNLDQGDGYRKKNKQKFRDFRIVKGKRVPTKNTLIEKRGYRSDTPGEKAGLTFAQFDARQSKRAFGLPTRKSSKQSKRRTPFGF